MVIRRTISLSNELNKWLVDNPDLKPSWIFQQALRNIKNQRDLAHGRTKILEENIKKLQARLERALELLDQKNG